RLLSHTDNVRWFFVIDDQENDDIVLSANNAEKPNDTVSADAQVEAVEILPSRWLETMLRVVDNKSDYNIVFRVWGNVTVFQKRNYLSISLVATESLFGDMKAQVEETRSYSPFASEQAGGADLVQEQNIESVVPQAVRDKLMSIPRVEILSFPFKMKETDVNTVTLEDSETQYFKNDMIITNRIGRLFPSQSEGRVYFMFESGDSTSGAAQIVIHPCLLLEQMLQKANASLGQSLKFRISGRVDEFKGEFFLLPSMYLQEKN
ncbi:MAG: hypothetical protein JXM68_06390, partial [Sedimentisphaerales bacterium]|nr:hypothetical protein [Sedimentisphaerales bacterium]